MSTRNRGAEGEVLPLSYFRLEVGHDADAVCSSDRRAHRMFAWTEDWPAALARAQPPKVQPARRHGYTRSPRPFPRWQESPDSVTHGEMRVLLGLRVGPSLKPLSWEPAWGRSSRLLCGDFHAAAT